MNDSGEVSGMRTLAVLGMPVPASEAERRRTEVQRRSAAVTLADRATVVTCSCNGVRICATCHDWAHSGDGRREAEAEGLIIPRVTAAPWTLPVLVHLEVDEDGQRKFPSCDGRWLDYMPGSEAA